MKRSEINQAIVEAKKMMENYSWVLPQWGYWSKEDYSNEPSVSKYLKDHLLDQLIDHKKNRYKNMKKLQ